jgi:hypothetical protein
MGNTLAERKGERRRINGWIRTSERKEERRKGWISGGGGGEGGGKGMEAEQQSLVSRAVNTNL